LHARPQVGDELPHERFLDPIPRHQQPDGTVGQHLIERQLNTRASLTSRSAHRQSPDSNSEVRPEVPFRDVRQRTSRQASIVKAGISS
jgi:hypothetical protein